MEQVIHVDENDQQIGVGEKIETHQQNRLHRGFSIFVFNSKGETLLQQRARGKYHCGGLWVNTCCGHPRPGETVEAAVHRRMREELGIDCDFTKIGKYVYQVDFENGLHEHEFLHVFSGTADVTPQPNPDEVMAWKWMPMDALKKDMRDHPENYAYWFKVSIEKLFATPPKR